MINLQGKTAIVTGASRGIGRAISLQLARLNAKVAINYIGSNEEALVTQQLCCDLGAETLLVEANVCDFAACEAMFKAVEQTFGSIDILVNNAGITRDGLLPRMSEDDFDAVLNTNLKGAFNCCKLAFRPMMKNKGGRIINISSVVGLNGNAGQANYSASKAGLIGLTKSAAQEYARRNITVNAIAPGFIQTDMTEQLAEEVKQSMLAGIPLARLGQPEDVAKAVAFLASDAAAYITGEVLRVDGGMAM